MLPDSFPPPASFMHIFACSHTHFPDIPLAFLTEMEAVCRAKVTSVWRHRMEEVSEQNVRENVTVRTCCPPKVPDITRSYEFMGKMRLIIPKH